MLDCHVVPHLSVVLKASQRSVQGLVNPSSYKIGSSLTPICSISLVVAISHFWMFR